MFHPKSVGGRWTLYPDPVDFRNCQLADACPDTSAFVPNAGGWWVPERFTMRDSDGQPLTTIRQIMRLEAVLRSHERSAEQMNAWDAVYGPVRPDGYLAALWHMRSGHIDRRVADDMRDHGSDVRAYLAKHWPAIGPDPVDRILVHVVNADTFYLYPAVYRLQDFFAGAGNPRHAGACEYGRPMTSHGRRPFTNVELVG